MTDWAPGPALAAFHAGVTVVCELAAHFTDESWASPTPCPEWRAGDLAGHLRCVADDLNEYLDDAPASRLTRLMATGADPARLARKLARQNAAELAALAEGQGPEHIAAFAASARAYARRLLPVWDLPHHRYRETVVTVGGMAGAACVEWHLHAWARTTLPPTPTSWPPGGRWACLISRSASRSPWPRAVPPPPGVAS
jgi:hypothetical protein